MRILYILQQVPFPPTNGIKGKTFNLLTYIVKNHDCDVICFGSKNENNINELNKICPKIRTLGVYSPNSSIFLRAAQAFALFFSHKLPASLRYSNKKLKNAICSAINDNQYDLVHIDTIALLHYHDVVSHIPTILSINDSLSLAITKSGESARWPIEKFKYHIFARRARKIERNILKNFFAVHVVSKEDAHHLEAKIGLNNIVVIELACESKFFGIPYAKQGGKIRLFSNGRYDVGYIRDPLVNFIENHWKSICNNYKNVEWVIVGKNAAQHFGRFYDKYGNILVKDWVDDYMIELEKSDICVFMDSSGTGLKTRVVQALAAGRPVVGSRSVFSGILIEDGKHGFIPSDEYGYFKIICKLIESYQLRTQTGESAREFAKNLFTAESTGVKWEQLYAKAMEKKNTQYKLS